MNADNHEENVEQISERKIENQPEEPQAATSKEKKITENNIIEKPKWNIPRLPNILQNVPADMLTVTFEGKKVDNGKVLTPTEVKNKPILKWKTEEGCLYLLAMVDPDAPTMKNPKLRLYQHWIVGNVPGTEVDKGTVLTEYLSAAPPKNSGQHRYVFLVYKQPGQISFTEKKIGKRTGKGREKFDIDIFAQNYKLREPIAGHFYIAEWDSYVTTVEKQFGVV